MKAFPKSYSQYPTNDGMDLKDYFAARAMQAMIGQCTNGNFDDFVIAKAAYQMADFMIKERNLSEQSS
jgi:hypothetical protein